MKLRFEDTKQLNKDKLRNTLYLEDGTSKIDAIIVYEVDKEGWELKTFFANLKKTGVQLHPVHLASDRNLIFVRLHAPTDILEKYADKYGVSLRKDTNIKYPPDKVPFSFLRTVLNSPWFDPYDPVIKRAWTTISKEVPTEITWCERSVIVFIIMDYIQFSDNSFDVGVRQLTDKKIIVEAYPLHDGPWEWTDDDPEEPLNDRQLLAQYWASFKSFFKQQPLHQVKNYYGYEIAIYFGFLGFYNSMLVYASILGLISFFSGIFFVKIYNSKHLHRFCSDCYVMCLKYLFISEETEKIKNNKYLVRGSCINAFVTYLNSNLGTFGYSIAIVLWCTFFKEKWKRQLNVYNARWDNPVIEDYILRPQFRAHAKRTRPHLYTREPELYIPLNELFLRYTISILGSFVTICIVLGSIVGIIVLEIYLRSQNYFCELVLIGMITFATLIIMVILEIVFDNNLLKLLAQIEMPKTELDYEKSIIVKSLVFSFFNNYGRLLYIAFIKGKIPYIRSIVAKPPRTFEYALPYDFCLPPNCVFEVIFLMAAILILKPIMLNIIEQIKMSFQSLLKRMKLKLKDDTTRPRWECDYALNSLDRRYILSQLNKLMIQFGFVTFFAACSPLAPLVALVYNLISLRMDASRFVKFYKRPVERKRVTSIGLCFDVFETMTFIAITFNALFTAYTCKFAHVFYNHKLGENATKDEIAFNEYTYINGCYLSGFYNGTSMYLEDSHYDLLTYKAYLALLFLLLGFIVSGIISYMIADVPRDLQEFIHFHELKKKLKTQ